MKNFNPANAPADRIGMVNPDGPVATRREFLKSLAGPIALASGFGLGVSRTGQCATKVNGSDASFETRGVVLVPDDFTWDAWPNRIKEAGLNTLAFHHGASPQTVVNFIRSAKGQAVLKECRRLGLRVEYELHAIGELLPRSLFARNPEFFRVDGQDQRTPEGNLCVHSDPGLEIAAANALALAKILRPTTSRYFLWGDDGKPWCRCRKCRSYTDSDQALILENRLVSALRKVDRRAQVAHLAYSNTLQPPTQVRPAPGIFLEYAPIRRRYDLPYESQTGRDDQDGLAALDANLDIFDRASAQVLEYWLDVSRFSKWKKPAVKLPWSEQVFEADLKTYAKRGIRHVTSFGVFIDAEYVARFGEPPELAAYGRGLLKAGR